MEILIGWVAFAILAGVIASSKKRSFFGFFLLSMVLSPLIGIIAALIAKPNIAGIERAALVSGANKRCPQCAELIRAEAIKCRFCGSDLSAHEAPPPENATVGYEVGKKVGTLFKGLDTPHNP